MAREFAVDEIYKKHSSIPYNPKMADVFYKAGEIESWGRGFDKIMEVCEKEKAPYPDIDANSRGVMVLCKQLFVGLLAQAQLAGLIRGCGKMKLIHNIVVLLHASQHILWIIYYFPASSFFIVKKGERKNIFSRHCSESYHYFIKSI